MVRSPGSGLGSSQGRFMSLGMASSKLCCIASRASRRSLAKPVCVEAARARLPSGSLTTWMGFSSSPPFVVWPRRKIGSLSWSSISKSSSTSLSASRPCSSSQSRRSWFSSTPECCSCRASHISYSESFFFCRRFFLADSLSANSILMPVILPTAGSSSFLRLRIGLDTSLSSASAARLFRGFRSSPVSWSTSRMDRLSFDPAMLMILTNTSWLRFTQSAVRATIRVSLVSSVRWHSPSLRPSALSIWMKAPNSITRETCPL
mmetsp:Transcript_25412/g.71749  ORF Transcript_25412/g.71749 Transcript_25412/m.71749 type:complete len:262 (+) Transcript_25412:2217-3002(+)